MNEQFSKAVARRIRELGAIAHERHLIAALTELEDEFTKWHRGEIDAFSLSEAIQRFHDATGREIWKSYETGSLLPFQVAADIKGGTITDEEAGPEVLAALRPHMEVGRS